MLKVRPKITKSLRETIRNSDFTKSGLNKIATEIRKFKRGRF